jgi:hypothetical protein
VDSFQITRLVMAFTRVSPACKDAVCALEKGFHDKEGVDAAGAHDPHHPDVWRILEA